MLAAITHGTLRALRAARDWGHLVYPPACAMCHRAVEPGTPLCSECSPDARRLEAPFCAVCSWPYPQLVPGLTAAPLSTLPVMRSCANCQDRAFAFDCAVSTRRHDGVVRDLIVRFKYGHELHLRRVLAGWLAESLDDARIASRPADALVPVPLHPRRRRERGFNQAEELCRILARTAGLPVWTALRRARSTGTQTLFSREERARNLAGAFRLAGFSRGRRRWRERLDGAEILLVDDVFTSGATVDACARVLRTAGAAGVRVITVARR